MLARRHREFWFTLAAALGVLALVISMGSVALGWYHHDATSVNPLAPVLSFLLAASIATVGLVRWWVRRRRAAAAPMTAEQVGRAVATLAEVVAVQWRQEATARSLGDLEPMPVRWRLLASASGTPVMDHPEVIASAGLGFTGSSDQISEVVAAFRRLDHHRLVITGGAGTGKTTLAVQLLLELLTHPQPGEPVPVLVSLVGWDPQEQPRLEDWLNARLERDYPGLRGFGVETARVLVERGKILPILDGLDEVPTTVRPSILTALNDATLPVGSGLIVTSRRAEYAGAVASAGDVLTGATVIAPLALTRREAASYLRKLLPPDPGVAWSRVLDQLETGTATELATVTASPLGLWLVRTVYLDGHRDPTALVQDTHPDRAAYSTLRAHLLDQLIPAVLRSRPPIPARRSVDASAPLRPRRQYDPDQVRGWLTTFAEELRAAGTRDWLWWHLARHAFPTTRTTLTVRLVVGLAFGLAFGLEFGLVLGLAFGLAFGLVSGLTAAPAHMDLRLRGRVPELLRSLAFGLVFGLALGLVGGLRVGPVIGPVIGPGGRLGVELVVRLGVELGVELGGGLVFGLLFGLIIFGASPSIAQRASSPAESQRGDRRLTVLAASTSGLVGGLVGGRAGGLVFGLTVGLVGGLLFGVIRAWPAFLGASGWLVVRRRFPWRLMVFLEDAYRLGLLRVVGSAYQFRHAELQDHLAPPRSGATRST